jgi:hypothetical protein
VYKLLLQLYMPGAQFHHGDCVGADAEAALLAKCIGYRVVAHPGCDNYGSSPKRAYFNGNDETRLAAQYATRNQNIIDGCEVLILAPKTTVEQRGSSTWSVYRFGQRTGRIIHLVEPSNAVG